MLELPPIKKVLANPVAGAHNRLYRGGSIERKAPCIVQSPLYNSTFPFNDTLRINPAQHPITLNK